MANILLIGDEGSRKMLRDVLVACIRMKITMLRLGDELAVRNAEVRPSSYRTIIIAQANLPPCDPSTPIDRLPDPKWHLRDSSNGGLQVLNWLMEDIRKQKVPMPHVFMGCHVAVTCHDPDNRANIKSRGAIPFYIDSSTTSDYTADGTLTMAGLINRLAELT